MKANSPGRPTELNNSVHKRIIDAVPKVIISSQVAALARVPKQTLSRWLLTGEKDSEKGIRSPYAQLWDDFAYAQAKIVKETLETLRTCPKNYQALTWILERCLRKDFGVDSDEIKELIRNMELIINARKGGLGHEEGNQEGSEESS